MDLGYGMFHVGPCMMQAAGMDNAGPLDGAGSQGLWMERGHSVMKTYKPALRDY